MPKDEFDIEILADGTIKVSTGAVSPANHMNAEAFMRFIQEKTGGKTTRTHKGGHHHHGHTHDHKHDEETH